MYTKAYEGMNKRVLFFCLVVGKLFTEGAVKRWLLTYWQALYVKTAQVEESWGTGNVTWKLYCAHSEAYSF